MASYKQLFYILGLFFIFTLDFSCHKVLSQESLPVLKGGLTTVIQKGEIINVHLSTPLNFYFSQSGDKVACFTNEDIILGEKSYIPKGSRIEGIITNIKEPKGFGQNGSFEIRFNEIVTPENISIPISATVSSDIQSSSEKAAEILSYDTALIAYGTAHGLIAGVQYGGIPLAIASHGISLLAGAGIGAGAGIIGSAVRKGKLPTVITGSNTLLSLKSDLIVLGELPKIELSRGLSKQAQKEEKEQFKGFRFFPRINKNEIKLSILKIQKEHSKTFGDYLVIEIKIKNDSQESISFTDIVLINNKDSNLLHADLFLTGTRALESIKPLDEKSTSLAFTINEKNKKLENYSLAIIDPLDGGEILRIPVIISDYDKTNSGEKNGI